MNTIIIPLSKNTDFPVEIPQLISPHQEELKLVNSQPLKSTTTLVEQMAWHRITPTEDGFYFPRR